jgi:hypothetical protein
MYMHTSVLHWGSPKSCENGDPGVPKYEELEPGSPIWLSRLELEGGATDSRHST